jgi:hypothetical protein
MGKRSVLVIRSGLRREDQIQWLGIERGLIVPQALGVGGKGD